MAQAYTPGLKVSDHLTHRVRRILPLKGDVLVKKGDAVTAEQVVASTAMPGEITPVNMANLLSMPAGDVKDCMLVQEGDRVEVGSDLAETPGIFGKFKKTVQSKHAGILETISDVTGQLIIRGEPMPVEVQAYLAGRVIEIIPDEGVVIEAEVSFIQGIFGIGGEAYGPIRIVGEESDTDLTPDLIEEDMAGCVVVGGRRIWNETVKKAIDIGVSALVAGGIDDQDLKKILGYDLGVAITGTETIGISFIITEGFGEIAMAGQTFDLLRARAGEEASVSGATQIRAGVMRPEIIIPHVDGKKAGSGPGKDLDGQLELGRPIRIIRDPWFGMIGTVDSLPSEPAVLESGSRARVLGVRLEGGESVIVPRANVELIEN